jgi:hypothetical protein
MYVCNFVVFLLTHARHGAHTPDGTTTPHNRTTMMAGKKHRVNESAGLHANPISKPSRLIEQSYFVLTTFIVFVSLIEVSLEK